MRLMSWCILLCVQIGNDSVLESGKTLESASTAKMSAYWSGSALEVHCASTSEWQRIGSGSALREAVICEWRGSWSDWAVQGISDEATGVMEHLQWWSIWSVGMFEVSTCASLTLQKMWCQKIKIVIMALKKQLSQTFSFLIPKKSYSCIKILLKLLFKN